MPKSYQDRTAHITESEYDHWCEELRGVIERMAEALKLSRADACQLTTDMMGFIDI